MRHITFSFIFAISISKSLFILEDDDDDDEVEGEFVKDGCSGDVILEEDVELDKVDSLLFATVDVVDDVVNLLLSVGEGVLGGSFLLVIGVLDALVVRVDDLLANVDVVLETKGVRAEDT